MPKMARIGVSFFFVIIFGCSMSTFFSDKKVFKGENGKKVIVLKYLNEWRTFLHLISATTLVSRPSTAKSVASTVVISDVSIYFETTYTFVGSNDFQQLDSGIKLKLTAIAEVRFDKDAVQVPVARLFCVSYFTSCNRHSMNIHFGCFLKEFYNF